MILISINPDFGNRGRAYWKNLQSSGQNGQFCAKWLPNQRMDKTNPSVDGIALNFKEGCVLLFVSDVNDNFVYVYKNVSVGSMLGKVNRALEIAKQKGGSLEIPGLPQDAIKVVLSKLGFVQNDLSRVIAESIIPAGWTSFDYFQTEEINPNIHPDLGGYLLAKRIVECNE